MTDPVKEAVERLDRAAKFLDDEHVARVSAGDLRTVLSELSRLSRFVEEAGEALDLIERKISALAKDAQASLTHKTIKDAQ